MRATPLTTSSTVPGEVCLSSLSKDIKNPEEESDGNI